LGAATTGACERASEAAAEAQSGQERGKGERERSGAP
jgi:hypothetical protein